MPLGISKIFGIGEGREIPFGRTACAVSLSFFSFGSLNENKKERGRREDNEKRINGMLLMKWHSLEGIQLHFEDALPAFCLDILGEKKNKKKGMQNGERSVYLESLGKWEENGRKMDTFAIEVGN